MVSYTPQFKHKNNQKASTDCAERCPDAIYTYVTSSAAQRHVKVQSN